MQYTHERRLATPPAWYKEALGRTFRGLTSKKATRPSNCEIVLSRSGSEVIGPSGTVGLSDDERDLLAHLLKNRGIVFTPETILSRVWGTTRVRDREFLGATVASTNDALRRAGLPAKLIEHVRDVGYRLADHGAAASELHESSTTD